MRPFSFIEPKDLSEACSLLLEHQNDAKALAGGTDLLVAMKERQVTPEYLINLKGLPDLDQIRQMAEALGKIQAEIEYERVIHFGELRSIISPDQRKKFDRLIEDLLERTHGPIEDIGVGGQFPVSMHELEHGYLN